MTTQKTIEGVQPVPADVALYQQGRQGKEFSYSLPLKPGLYALRLKFAEPQYEAPFQRPMNLWINGRQVMNNVDICQAARGPWRLTNASSAILSPMQRAGWSCVLRADSSRSRPRTRPWCRPSKSCPNSSPRSASTPRDKPFIDWNGFVWSADGNFEGGRVIRSEAKVSQAAPTLYDQALYRTARCGKSFSYTVAVPPGLYSVHLKFAELWLTQLGQRPMNIEVNGRRVWTALGSGHGRRPDGDGRRDPHGGHHAGQGWQDHGSRQRRRRQRGDPARDRNRVSSKSVKNALHLTLRDRITLKPIHPRQPDCYWIKSQRCVATGRSPGRRGRFGS